jgi:hypothetical protein
MNWFPQIGSGAIAQFPVTRTRTWHNIINLIESGEQVTLPDADGGLIQWRLSYQDLTATEVQNLNSLYVTSQGSFAPFTFADPLANLLGWSEQFTQPGWQAGLLQIVTGANDPLGTHRASTINNPNSGSQALSQSVGLAGSMVTCFSAWVRSNSGAQITLSRDTAQTNVTATPVWTRIYLSGTGASGSTNTTFSLTIPAGQTVDVWGLQVEAQPYPSIYMQTGAAYGIYEETYFATDQLTITATAPGLSACDIQLVSRVIA